ncbi:MAG: hypothetical protein WBD71_02010 [Xanthobacteraceae bacterium]
MSDDAKTFSSALVSSMAIKKRSLNRDDETFSSRRRSREFSAVFFLFSLRMIHSALLGVTAGMHHAGGGMADVRGDAKGLEHS